MSSKSTVSGLYNSRGVMSFDWFRRGSSALNDDLVLPDNLEGDGIDTSIKPLAF